MVPKALRGAFTSVLANEDPFVIGTLPADGTIYDQDLVPFATPTVGAAVAIGAQLQISVMPDCVPLAVRESIHPFTS